MGKAAVGTTLTVGSLVAEVVSVGGPDISRDMIDVSHLTSTSQWKEFVAGLKDGGTVAFDINVTTANLTAIFHASTGLINLAASSSCSIVLAGSMGTISFSGWLQNARVNAPVGDKQSVSCTVKVTGAVTYA